MDLSGAKSSSLHPTFANVPATIVAAVYHFTYYFKDGNLVILVGAFIILEVDFILMSVRYSMSSYRHSLDTRGYSETHPLCLDLDALPSKLVKGRQAIFLCVFQEYQASISSAALDIVPPVSQHLPALTIHKLQKSGSHLATIWEFELSPFAR
jgi:hypothetical protein